MTVSNASLDVLSASALEVAQAVHSRAISAQEALAACIARIEEVNPALNAVVQKLYDSATREAARFDALSEEERKALPLAGVLHRQGLLI